MGDEAGEILASDAVAKEDGFGGLGHFADGELVDGAAVLVDEVHGLLATVSAVAGWRLPPPGMLSETAPEPSISWK